VPNQDVHPVDPLPILPLAGTVDIVCHPTTTDTDCGNVQQFIIPLKYPPFPPNK
jgi:hypothetical protein